MGLLPSTEQVKCPHLAGCSGVCHPCSPAGLQCCRRSWRVVAGVSAAWIRDPFPPSVVQAGGRSPRLVRTEGWEHPHWNPQLWAHSGWEGCLLTGPDLGWWLTGNRKHAISVPSKDAVGCIVSRPLPHAPSLPHSSVDALIPRASECDCIWRWGGGVSLKRLLN